MHISLNRATAGGSLPLPDFVALAANAGFPAADVDLAYGAQHGPTALRDLYAKHNLSFGGWGPIADWRNDESKLTETLPTFREHAKIAGDLRIDSCATWIMPSSDRPLLENFRFHVTRLKPVAETLADHGLRLGLEFVAPHHLRRKFKHEFLFTPGQMLELAAEIAPNVGLLVDAFHCHTSATPFSEIANLPKDKIVLAHFNDAPKGKALHEIEDGDRHIPGDGSLDLPAFFAALKQTGYTGPASLEIFNADLRALPPAEAAKRAAAGTRRALAGLGLM